ncbi:MAG: hypothetical protein CSB47_06965 [Proteobacteria bacterium]|nr:MAG: hypothetical protein CSB47_06965 [Pseudomonadota bacterium]
MQSTNTKLLEGRTAPINLRAQPTQRQIIDRAASLMGKNRSDFMLEVACREAMNVLLDQRLFFLDGAQSAAFDDALSAPIGAEQQVRIRQLLDTKSPWES